MKYKNLNIAVENVLEFCGSKELLSRLTSLFLSSISTRISLKEYLFRCYKWRLVISINRLIELAKDWFIYMKQELDTEVQS